MDLHDNSYHLNFCTIKAPWVAHALFLSNEISTTVSKLNYICRCFPKNALDTFFFTVNRTFCK